MVAMVRGCTSFAQVPRSGEELSAMGLRKLWQRIRPRSERPHNLLAISDLHLGRDLKPGTALDRPLPADSALVSFLDWHAAHRSRGKPWRLILDGDIVDFVAITLVPLEAPFSITAEERSLGLAPSEPKSVWKLQRTAERHRAVIDAFSRFLEKGHSLHVIRGNHDAEWRWPAVQAEFPRILVGRCCLTSAAARRRLERAVHVHDWFYLQPGFFYAEHGHAHDRYSVGTHFFAGAGPKPCEEMRLSLSSKMLRYFVNRYSEQVELADDVDAWGVQQYLAWVLRAGNPLRIAADYFVMMFRVLYPIPRRPLAVAHPPSTDELAQKLLRVSARPGEQSLFDSMQLFYLDRMLLALLCLLCAFAAGSALHGFLPRAGALTAVGILFAALNAQLAGRRKTDAHPMLLQAARRVAQVFDVKS